MIKKIHHVAYRCKDAYATAKWYEENLDMKLVLAIAEDHVPSTGDFDPYMHIFLDAGMGNVLAFLSYHSNQKWGEMKTHLNGPNI